MSIIIDQFNIITDDDIHAIPDPEEYYWHLPTTRSKGLTLLMKYVMLAREYDWLHDIIKDYIKNNPNELNKCTNLGYTALIIASSLSNFTSTERTVKLLIDAGANVNLQTGLLFNNFTALQLAAMYSNRYSTINTVQMLIDAGSNLESINNEKDTVLTLIIDKVYTTSSHETLELILKYGSNVDHTNGLYQNALSIAFKTLYVNTSIKTINILLKYNANINFEYKFGYNILMKSYNPLRFIDLNKIKYEPFINDFIKQFNLIISLGFDINKKNKDEYNFLAFILKYPTKNKNFNFDLIKLLLENGSDTNININGKNIIDLLLLSFKNLNPEDFKHLFKSFIDYVEILDYKIFNSIISIYKNDIVEFCINLLLNKNKKFIIDENINRDVENDLLINLINKDYSFEIISNIIKFYHTNNIKFNIHTHTYIKDQKLMNLLLEYWPYFEYPVLKMNDDLEMMVLSAIMHCSYNITLEQYKYFMKICWKYPHHDKICKQVIEYYNLRQTKIKLINDKYINNMINRIKYADNTIASLCLQYRFPHIPETFDAVSLLNNSRITDFFATTNHKLLEKRMSDYIDN
jgi:hypothetical protein